MSEYLQTKMARFSSSISSSEFRVIAVVLVALLSVSTPMTGSANEHKNGAAQNGGQVSQFQSVDEATGYILSQHPGARIVKVVRKKRADGSHVAQFRILTSDGRMKKINVNID